MPTLRDVAKAAGVAVGTVSNVLNNTAAVSDETRRRVIQAMEQLNYRPGGRRSRTVGIVIADITKDIYPPVVKGVQEVFDQHGITLVLFNSDYETAREERFLGHLRDGQLDGLIFMSSSKQAETSHLVAAREAGCPIVTINRPVLAGMIDQIRLDTAGGVARAVQHLVDLGHSRIGFLSGPYGTVQRPTPWDLRLMGYRHGMQAAGLAPEPDWMLQTSDGGYEAGYAAMKGVLACPDAPAAWIVASDTLAIGAMNAARAMGVSLPEDLAVVGVGGMPAGVFTVPGLTTVSLPIYEAGRLSAEMLLRRLNDPEAPTERITMPCELIVRGSCGARVPQPVTR